MVAGKYKAEGVVLGSEMESEVEYIVDGNVLTGTIVVLGDKIAVEGGTVEGNHFKHICNANTPMGKLKIRVEGDVNGDDIVFMLRTPMGKSEFTGYRI